MGNLEESQSWKGTMRQNTESIEREEVGEVHTLMENRPMGCGAGEVGLEV